MGGNSSLRWPPLAQICECFNAKTCRVDGYFHLRWNRNETFAMCQRQVSNGTMIPVSAWGAADAKWCPACQRRAGRPQPLIAAKEAEGVI
jgi:hypothetical protein